MHNVYYAGRNLDEFKTFITNAGVYSTPARSYESIPVAGRSGNLLMENNKFENVEHLYPIIILEDFDKNYAALKSFLLSKRGYQRLSDSFYPDEYYLATFSRFDNTNQKFIDGQMGTSVLVFERKPQRFLKSGEKKITINTAGSIKNPTHFEALPFIRVYGSGTLTINNTSITINTDYAHLDIDCELQEVLQVDGNLDITLTNGKFPVLSTGVNEVSFSGLTSVEITPRWYVL